MRDGRVQPSKLVLVVEDNPLVQLTACDVLEGSGLRAVAASNADDALAMLEERDDIGALFTDVDMPGSMDGLALIELVCRRWPTICAVVTSAGPPPRNRPLPAHVHYYQKPYDQREVIAALGG